mgnify:CR=1 FL=1
MYQNVIQVYTDSMRQLPDDNLKYPVLVKDDKGNPIGSGVFISVDKFVYFVTAKHVVFNNETGILTHPAIGLLYYSKDADTTNEISIDTKAIIPHATSDVVVIRVGAKTAIPETKNYRLQFEKYVTVLNLSGILVNVSNENLKLYEDIKISNDIFLLGYPVSLANSRFINPLRPLLRKGIVAGKNDTLRVAVLDCPVYQGNSGCPVLEYEHVSVTRTEIKLIGIAIEFVPFVEITQSLYYKYKNSTIENSGYSILVPVDFILELIKADIATIKPSS